MRQQPSGRRPRGRSNRKHFVPHRSQTFDSHGPDVRVRGNAMQVYEKYVNLARDANSAGDRIVAESYQQYAEHYYRIINDTTDPQRPPSERPDSDRGAPERAGSERAGSERESGRGQPYPMDAEQPFVDGGALGSASGGNGQAAEAKAGPAESGEPSASDGATESPPAEKAKPRGRGRGRAKSGNGAVAEDGAEDAATSSSAEPGEAGEPTT